MVAKGEKCAKVVLGGALLFFAAVFLYALYRSDDIYPPWEVKKYYVASLLGIALFGFTLRLRTRVKVKLALIVLSIAVAVYLAEIFLFFTADIHPISIERLQEKSKVPVDPRSRFEMVVDLRRQGVDAYPTIYPELFIASDGLNTGGSRIFPLGSISNKITVYCPEEGQYMIYRSDEHGFNNPEGLYKRREVDIVLVGDSFAHGACVRPGEDIAGQLRKYGRNVLSLGYGGNGPLIELATIKEYAEPLKPKIVLWIYYGNDLTDLLNEAKSNILMKYLVDDVSQGLFDRQVEVDRVLINYIEGEIEMRKGKEQKKKKEEKGGGKEIFHSAPFRIVKLVNWRFRLGLIHLSPPPLPPLFSKVLAEARDRVSSWGGELYFVYLPMGRDLINPANYYVSYRRKQVLSLVEDLGISIIDFNAVLSAQPDPLSFFPFRRPDFHYNAKGYSLLAQTIETHLQNRTAR